MGSVKVPFTVEGCAIAMLGKDDKSAPTDLEGLWVQVAGTVLAMRFSKSVRSRAATLPLQGAQLRLVGTEKLDLRTGDQQFKVRVLEVLEPGTGPLAPACAPTQDAAPCNRVDFCGKKNCRRRGGEAAFKALEAELAAQGRAEAVDLRWVGCLNGCKAGPAARYGSTVQTGMTPAIAKQLARELAAANADDRGADRPGVLRP